MITRWKLGNNVQHTMASSISAVDTSVTLNQASVPYKSVAPPDSKAQNGRGVITLQDSLNNPTKVEIVTFNLWVDNGDGTITLSGLLRGQESTVASAFDAGDYAIQTVTSDGLNTPLIELDHDGELVRVNGSGEPENPSLIAKGGAIRVESLDEFGSIAFECSAPGHAYGEGFFRIVSGPDGTVFYSTNPNDPSFSSGVFSAGFLEVNWSLYPPDFTKKVVLIENLSVRRMEQVKAIRHDVDGNGALAANVNIDWSAHDIRRMSLAANSAVTMSDTSQFYPNDGKYRKLTFLIDIGSVNPGFAVTWSANVKWPDGAAAPLFNTGTNQTRAIDFLYDGTNFLAEAMRTYQL